MPDAAHITTATEPGGGASATTDPAAGSSAATDVSLKEHLMALLFERRRGEEKFMAERDRRLQEVKIETEKAIKIKETADLAALELAREIQTYKDEKANELRSQIERERGEYIGRGEFTSQMEKLAQAIAPANAYVQAQTQPKAITGATIAATFAAISALGGAGFIVATREEAPPEPIVVTVPNQPAEAPRAP